MPTAFRRLTPWLGRVLSCAALLLSPVLTGCQALQNVNHFTVEEEIELGGMAFEELRAEYTEVTTGPEAARVQRVTDRLVAAALVEAGAFAETFPWEVTLLDAPDVVNASCLPGGKMTVFTGILPVTQSDAGLAVVMGHEIAHATCRHGAKAVSRQQIMVGGLSMLQVILMAREDDPAYAMIAANMAATLLSLSYGRDAELEADRIGLRTMARAGYDPREAVAFWGRMEAAGGGGPPEWLSTHPSHGSRIEQLESLLPEAIALYESR